MKLSIMFISLILFLDISCSNSQKEKELELKEREIIVKEKEIEFKNDVLLNNKDLSKTKETIQHDSKSKYLSYCNDRFKFCIDYPSSFEPQGESYNADGQIFLSTDNETEIRAFGGLAVEDLNKNIEEEFALATINKNITYKILKKDWFVISGYEENGKIFYRKTVKKNINYNNYEKTDVYQTLMISYPESQKFVYSDYCKKIANSL